MSGRAIGARGSAGVGALSGTVTFLFTDIEGSTRTWDVAPTAMREALARHDEILRSAIETHGGFVFSTGGDGFAAAFGRAEDALAAAMDAQAGLGSQVWPDEALIRVRMGYTRARLSRHDEGRRLPNAASLWLDIAWGHTLVGLHRPGAVERLARAVQAADRQGATNAEGQALRLLAIAVAERGYQTEAARLAGYAEANLSADQIRAAHGWAQATLDEALVGMDKRSAHEAAGAALTRGQVMALVTHLDSVIDRAGQLIARPREAAHRRVESSERSTPAEGVDVTI
jgi:hypothetical protein